MGRNRVQVDLITFERLVDATIAGDIVAARAAIDEMALVHDGVSQVGRFIQRARARARGIVDKEVAPFVLPVPGLRVGSTLSMPRRLPTDPVTGCLATVADAEAPVEKTLSQ